MTGHLIGIVRALTVYNGKLILGGILSAGNGTYNIAAWDGTSISTMGTGLGTAGNGNVTALAVHNGELYAAGQFSVPGAPALVNLAKWNGTEWVVVDTSIQVGSITSLHSFAGTLWAGGSFTDAGGHFQPYLTQLFCSCYANCDGSAAAPILTANDFQCFLNQFSQGSAYANCDGSGVAPVLTANDFQCFLNAFASGCN